MARLRVAAALEDERKRDLELQQNGGPSTSSINKSCSSSVYGHGSPVGTRGRLPSVAKFLSARRRLTKKAELFTRTSEF